MMCVCVNEGARHMRVVITAVSEREANFHRFGFMSVGQINAAAQSKGQAGAASRCARHISRPARLSERPQR